MNQLFTAKKIQIEMLKDRGYEIPDKELIEEDKNYIKKFKKLTLNQSYHSDNDLYVYYIDEEEKLVDNMKKFVKIMKNYSHGIIIGNENDIKKLLSKSYKEYFDKLILKTIQVFTYDELQYNISQHILNGVYEKVAKSSVIPSIAHADEMSILLISDPIVKYYGYGVGDVIKITEDNDTNMINDKSISYCIVVNESM